MDGFGRYFLRHPLLVAVCVLCGLLALPLAVWFDLRNLSDESLHRQASTFNSVISSVRSYYAENIVGRVNGSDVETQTLHNYTDVDGAIPIPATLSIELGEAIKDIDGEVEYRFVSDYPFKDRPAHNLTGFEKDMLAQFRADPNGDPHSSTQKRQCL